MGNKLTEPQKKLFTKGAFILIIILLLENALFFYNRLNSQRPILGMKLSGAPVSHLSQSQIRLLLYKKFNSGKPLKLAFGTKQYLLSKDEIGASIEYNKTLSHVLEKGRSGNFFQNILIQNAALLGTVNAPVESHISKELLLVKTLSIADDINQEPEPPMPDFIHDIKKTIPSKHGLKVDSVKLGHIIQAYIFAPPSTAVAIPTSTVNKTFNTANLDTIRKQAADFTFQPIQLTIAGIPFTLNTNDLKALLTVKEKADPNDPNKNTLVLTLNTHKLNQRLDSFAQQVEKKTNREFDEHYIRTVIYQQFFSNSRSLAYIPTTPSLTNNVLGATTKTGPKTIYLTFDDGPNLIYQPMILDILKAKDVHATFYFVGANAQLYKTVTQRTIQEGHAIGDHTLTHANLPTLPNRKILDEIKSTQNILNSFLAPHQITLLRPPYGAINNYVWQTAKDLNLNVNYWTVDPRDWAEPTTNELIHRVVDKAKNDDIILLHSNHFATVKALPTIIDLLRKQGFQFATQS